MNLRIEKVEVGAKYEGVIYDDWIYARLQNGKKIKVFDHVPFDLRTNVKQNVDCLIVASFITLVNKKISNDELIATFIGEYTDCYEWVKVWENIHKKNGIYFKVITDCYYVI
jgi:hypothetical protein